MKKHIPTITIFIIIIGIIVLGIWYSDKNSPIKELAKLNIYSEEELSFLEEEGFLHNIDSENLPSNKEQIVSLLKSSNLIEQNLNSPDESFEVLATKLDENTYQLAFKLENKSNQSKEFYLIPISESSQTEFKEIKGVVKNGKVSWGDQGDWGYDIEKHKQELRPELAKAYDDIEKNGYTGKPIRLVLEANSTLLAQSKWEINGDRISDGLKPIYLLVYGSAGGVKDELTILTVHSSPQKGENWEVKFTTRGTADLRIIPNDQATIDDDEFTGLYCGNEKKNPQILAGDIIYYPNWQCNGIGKVIHYTKKAGHHTLRFEFGGQTAFAYNSPALIDGLISYWKLDDNLDTDVVIDIHSTNDGTVVNDQTNYSSEQSTTTAKIVRAFDFDGSNDYVSVADDASLDMPGLSLTLSVWIKTTQSSGSYPVIAGKGFLANNNGYGLFLSSGNNYDVVFQVRTGGTISSAVAGSVNDGEWHHIVGVRDHSNNESLIYVDGDYVANNVTALTDFSDDEDFGIGSRNDGPGWAFYFDGIIDEVTVWNRALEPDEITALYNGGDGLAYPFTGSVTDSVRIKGGFRVKGGLKIKF